MSGELQAWLKRGMGELNAYARAGYKDLTNNILPAFPETTRLADETGTMGTITPREAYEQKNSEPQVQAKQPEMEMEKD